MLTRSEIQQLEALAASDLRSVPNCVVWLVASDLEEQALARDWQSRIRCRSRTATTMIVLWILTRASEPSVQVLR